MSDDPDETEEDETEEEMFVRLYYKWKWTESFASLQDAAFALFDKNTTHEEREQEERRILLVLEDREKKKLQEERDRLAEKQRNPWHIPEKPRRG